MKMKMYEMKLRTKTRLIKCGMYLTILAFGVFGFTACVGKEKEIPQSLIQTQDLKSEELESTTHQETSEPSVSESLPETEEVKESFIKEIDCPEIFGEYHGAVVLFHPSESQYLVYQPEIAETRYSPCSTFKIISSAMGVESGVIDLKDSTRIWSGETFWNEKWNKDIAFEDAFRSSCIWYFKAVIDDLGPEYIKEELQTLQYGNCDITDWQGKQNVVGKNPALMGFWVESSLRISPMEQTQVMEKIFGGGDLYQRETVQALEWVMKQEEESSETCTIYGKSGMGRRENDTTDTWYVGFADTLKGRVYYSVFVGDQAGMKIPDGKAKEIAVQVIHDYSNGFYQ